MNANKTPIITLITVVFNDKKFLEETICSVINQSYKNIQYIIIDGGSTDGTVDVIKRFDKHIDYWISEKDEGIYDAMNKGLKIAKGEFIGFVNSGDILYKETLSILANEFNKTPFDYTVGPVDLISEKGELLEVMFPQKNFHVNKNFLKRMPTPHPAFFINNKFLKRIGLFNLKYKLSADFDMIIRSVLKSDNYYEFKNSVSAFREGGVSGSYQTFIENFSLLKAHNVSFVTRLKIIIPSLIKVFILKTFPSKLTYFLRTKFSSGYRKIIK